jgi:hypothetical protein
MYTADKQTRVPLAMYPNVPSSLLNWVQTILQPRRRSLSRRDGRVDDLKVDPFTITEAGQIVPLDARLLTTETDLKKRHLMLLFTIAKIAVAGI